MYIHIYIHIYVFVYNIHIYIYTDLYVYMNILTPRNRKVKTCLNCSKSRFCDFGSYETKYKMIHTSVTNN